MIPLTLAEVRPALRRKPGARAPRPRRHGVGGRRLQARGAGPPLRRRRPGWGVRRGGARARCRGRPVSGRRLRRPGRARPRSSEPVGGPLRRHHRLDRKDVHQGHPGRALPAARRHDRRRGELQRRARRAADPVPGGAGDRRLRAGAGHARVRPDRRPVPDRGADPGGDHERGARAPRVRRLCGGRGAREGGADRSPSARGDGHSPSDAPELRPFLGRSDLDFVTFGPDGDVRLEGLDVSGGQSRLEIRAGDQELQLEVGLRQRFQARNVLAAVAAYRALGLPLDGLAAGAPPT